MQLQVVLQEYSAIFGEVNVKFDSPPKKTLDQQCLQKTIN